MVDVLSTGKDHTERKYRKCSPIICEQPPPPELKYIDFEGNHLLCV